MHDSLSQVVALVVASAVIAYICHRLNILPIVGFLIAGVVIGPNALGLVEDAAFIEFVAEIGVVLLLFTLGIEFSLDRVWRIRRAIFAGGGLQLVLTIAAAMGILALLGVEWRTGFFTGALIALSSTAIVLKVLNDSGEVTSAKGQLSLGILIFQDLAIVALVLVMPLLAGGRGSTIAIVRGLGLAALIVVLVVVVARRVMPLILERVARTCSQEIFLLTIIAICLGTAWLTSLAGVSLSLGAFLAGLVVSESRYSHHAFAEILPLQILFSAVFFVSVGLLLDLAFLVQHPLLVIGVVAAVVLLKTAITGAVARILGYSTAVAGSTALLLAQIGEFSFVLERVGRAAGLHPGGLAGTGGQTFIAAAVILMAGTPLLAHAGRVLESRRDSVPEAEPEPEETTLANHVIVAGLGAAARQLTRELRLAEVPFIIVTLSPTTSAAAQADGMEVIVGDYSRRHLLDAVGIERAKMLVIADDAPEMARRVTAVARGLNPRLQILVRTHVEKDVEELLSEGADRVVVDERESSAQLVTRVLNEYQVRSERREDARMTTGRTVRLTKEQRGACDHAAHMQAEVTTEARGCEECLKIGDTWVHLRICMQCGKVGCCDSSKNKHASKHWAADRHPVIRSFQPREEWAWCFPDELGF
jgi:monovalent cation:H+ antiporter-2, CPA2 family